MSSSTVGMMEEMESLSSVQTITTATNKRKKLVYGVSLLCIVGMLIGFGFLYTQNSGAVHEMIHYKDVEQEHHRGEPIAMAQRAVFDSDDTQSNNNPTPTTTTTTLAPPCNNGNSSASNPSPNPAPSGSGPLPRLPNNYEQKHPVSLIYELRLRPAPVFTSQTCPNTTPHHYYKMVLTVFGNGKEYLGFGTSKKVAKKMAAEQAITDLYGYSYSNSPDLATMAEDCGL